MHDHSLWMFTSPRREFREPGFNYLSEVVFAESCGELRRLSFSIVKLPTSIAEICLDDESAQKLGWQISNPGSWNSLSPRDLVEVDQGQDQDNDILYVGISYLSNHIILHDINIHYVINSTPGWSRSRSRTGAIYIYIYIYVYTYIHTYIHSYIHTYIHA